jgi:hypothetical protein
MTMRRLLAFAAVLALPALADTLTDPTRPPADWRPKSTQNPSAGAAPKLTSILVSRARRVATIDGVTVKEGESANGITVVRIEKTWVDARVGDRPVRLVLGDANVTKEVR